MGILDDFMDLENGSESELDAMVTMQRVINDGSGWKMQGSMGRAMSEAINAGQCMLGVKGHHDYYGNYIPSRTEINEDGEGSRQYVVVVMGEDWAAMLEAGEV